MNLLLGLVVALIVISGIGIVFSQTEQIPSWIKTTAAFWVDGVTTDHEFISAMEFLIDNGVIVIPKIVELEQEIMRLGQELENIQKQEETSETTDGVTTDHEFISAMEFLIDNGVIVIPKIVELEQEIMRLGLELENIQEQEETSETTSEPSSGTDSAPSGTEEQEETSETTSEPSSGTDSAPSGTEEQEETSETTSEPSSRTGSAPSGTEEQEETSETTSAPYVTTDKKGYTLGDTIQITGKKNVIEPEERRQNLKGEPIPLDEVLQIHMYLDDENYDRHVVGVICYIEENELTYCSSGGDYSRSEKQSARVVKNDGTFGFGIRVMDYYEPGIYYVVMSHSIESSQENLGSAESEPFVIQDAPDR